MHFRAVAGASLAVIALTVPAVANQDVIKQTANPEQWVLQTGDYTNQRFSKLNQINRDNVGQLTVAWTYNTGDASPGTTIECTPLVVDGVMYITTVRTKVVALDAAKGTELWSFDPYADTARTADERSRHRSARCREALACSPRRSGSSRCK